jgi:hypothetical protein
MLWNFLTRPLTVFLTIAGAALLAHVLLAITVALIKPLVNRTHEVPGRWTGAVKIPPVQEKIIKRLYQRCSE